jgi:cytochrome c-type biogenesis protein CcmH/NrfG
MFYFNTVHKYDKAVAVLTKSVHYSDAGVNDWKLLAHAYTREGKLQDALATWKTIKKMYPKAQMVDHNMQEVETMIQKESATKSE